VFQHAERPVTEGVSRGKPIVRSTAKRVYVAAVIASIVLAGVSAVVFSQHEKTAKPLADPGRVPSELVKIRNGFVITIPIQARGVLGSSALKDDQGQPYVAFNFVLPKYADQQSSGVDKSKFEKHIVTVSAVLALDPGHPEINAPNASPPFVLMRLLSPPVSMISANDYVDIDGLRCYHSEHPKDPVYDLCYGLRDKSIDEYILLHVLVDKDLSLFPNPQMYTEYLSKRYGGLWVRWRTSTANLPDWHEIDSRLWEILAGSNSAAAGINKSTP
jgi:hypothetical protein